MEHPLLLFNLWMKMKLNLQCLLMPCCVLDKRDLQGRVWGVPEFFWGGDSTSFTFMCVCELAISLLFWHHLLCFSAEFIAVGRNFHCLPSIFPGFPASMRVCPCAMFYGQSCLSCIWVLVSQLKVFDCIVFLEYVAWDKILFALL